MFKTPKDVDVRSHNALSKKDIKKLAKSVTAAFSLTVALELQLITDHLCSN